MSPLLGLHFSLSYELCLAQNSLLPAAFTNCPRIFFDSVQCLFWVFHYFVLVDFGRIAVSALFHNVYLAFLTGLLIPGGLSLSHHSDQHKVSKLRTVMSFRFGLCPFPPFLPHWTLFHVLLFSFIWRSLNLLFSPECLKSRSLPQVHSKMALAVIFMGSAYRRAVGSYYMPIVGGFNLPAVRSNRSQCTCFPPSRELWSSWNTVHRHGVPLAPVHAVLWGHGQGSRCSSLLCDHPLPFINSQSLCFIHETYGIFLWNPCALFSSVSPFLSFTFSRPCPTSKATVFVATPVGKFCRWLENRYWRHMT